MLNTLETERGNASDTQPKYQRLAARLREQILAQELNPGDRLPSFVALRKRHNVTLSTVERVYGLLEQEGLIERRQGSGTFVAVPRQTRTGNIGFIGSAFITTRQDPFDAHIIAGVRSAVDMEEQHLMYMGTDHSLDLRGCEKVDGMLICNIDDVAPVSNKLPVLMPRVSLLVVADGMTSVVADDYRGAKMAVRHLMKSGHRRIACLMEETPAISRLRFGGYRDALKEADVDADPRWCRVTDNVKKSKEQFPYLQWGKTHMRRWLREDWNELGCTAILIQNDIAAIGVMQVLQQAGIQVPQDVSVMGFDGTEVCDLASPNLTSMHLPLSEVGRRGIEMLNSQIVGEQNKEEVIMLPMSVREGKSVDVAR